MTRLPLQSGAGRISFKLAGVVTYGILLGAGALACGGEDDAGFPLPGRTGAGDEASATRPALPGTTATTIGGNQQSDGANRGSEGTSKDDIVLHQVNWFEVEDELGRPAVHYLAIVENTGSDPVEVRIEIEAFDDSGASVGSSLRRFSETLGGGARLPMALGAGPLDASPGTVEPRVSIHQIPEFRRERYGRVRLEGGVVEAKFEERSTDVMYTLTLTAMNVGTEGVDFPVFPHLAIYDAAGLLVDGGGAAPGFTGLCPGESGELEVTYRVFLDEFEPASASFELFFPDVEVFESAPC